jgi:hypothetical protein
LKALSIFNYAIQAPLEVVQEIAYCMIKRLWTTSFKQNSFVYMKYDE